jgi:DcmR-like sensory protein
MAQPISDHVCQFFDSDESRAEAAAAFLAAGVARDEHVIAVVPPERWTSIVERLRARGISVDDEMARHRLAVYDAAGTLARISPRGRLSPFAFNEVMGAALTVISGPIRAYGEMVDLLASRGELAEALELEELWNRVGEMLPITTLCGYLATHFVAASAHRALRDICLAHTDVRRDPHDALADWILTTAHHSGGSPFLH